MVDTVNEGCEQWATESVMALLDKAQKDETYDKASQQQDMDLNELRNALLKCETNEDRKHYLKMKTPGLFSLISDRLGEDVAQDIGQKMGVITDNFEQDASSEESEQEQEHALKEICEQEDGLLVFQTNLPLTSTKYSRFMRATQNISSSKHDKIFKELMRKLEADPIWRHDENSEFDALKFLESSLFKDKADSERVDWKMLKLVALYLCKQGSKARIFKIASLIAEESSGSQQMMDSGKFMEAVKIILEMAVIRFSSAVYETGYMEDPYQKSQYQCFEAAIQHLSENVRQQVFDGAPELDSQIWRQKSQLSDLSWLYKIKSIRERVHGCANVPMLHINEAEAKKMLARIQRQQGMIIEQALKEEQEEKQKQQILLDFLQHQSKRMGEVKTEINDPKNNMPAERFKEQTKFALIVVNEDYDEAITSMKTLPPAQNTLEKTRAVKARTIAKLMGVPAENTVELMNATHDELERQTEIITNRIKSLSRKLVQHTGILGWKNGQRGFEWDKMKKSAMKLHGDFDSIEVEYEDEDKAKILEMIQKQDQADSGGPELTQSELKTTISGVWWKDMKDIIMAGDRSGKSIRIPLNQDQQLLLMRYIEAEKQEKDFISRGLAHLFVQDIFFFVYYGGHGCADQKQHFVLNEREISKIFWPAESKMKTLLGRCGSNVKMLCVYDCCREPYQILMEKISKHLLTIDIQTFPQQNHENMQVKTLDKLSPEMIAKYRKIFSERHEDGTLPTTSIANYCAIFGSLPGENVKAVSTLSYELHELLLLMSLNFRQEVQIPECFVGFRGARQKNAIHNETSSYALGFGEKSKFDLATLKLFKEYADALNSELVDGQERRSFFSLIKDFYGIVVDVNKRFSWKKVECDQNEQKKQCTAMVYGECGQGKSTTLNKIVQLLAKDYPEQALGCNFQSKQSLESVTPCVQQGTVGHVTLIDTPGLNDPYALRTDQNIYVEMIKNLRPKLNDPAQGISSLVLCVLPSASQRITGTEFKAMRTMFQIFNSLDEGVDIKDHPKYMVVINNVSKYGDDYDPNEVLTNPDYVPPSTGSNLSVQQRIADFKSQVKDETKRFYLFDKVSDDSAVGDMTWKDVKKEICSGEAYINESWYTGLESHQQRLVSYLKQMQLEIGIDNPIEPQENKIRAKFIEDRIDELLPEQNFFFHKIFSGQSDEIDLKNAIELRELQRLLEANEQIDKFYLQEGHIEPQYLTEDERKMLTDGMVQSIEKIKYEVYKSICLAQQITGKPNLKLVERMKEIETIQKKFEYYLAEKPYIFQKFTLPSLVLAREIFSKARDEVNQQCMKDLVSEMSVKQAKLDEITRVNQKKVNEEFKIKEGQAHNEQRIPVSDVKRGTISGGQEVEKLLEEIQKLQTQNSQMASEILDKDAKIQKQAAQNAKKDAKIAEKDAKIAVIRALINNKKAKILNPKAD